MMIRFSNDVDEKQASFSKNQNVFSKIHRKMHVSYFLAYHVHNSIFVEYMTLIDLYPIIDN
jgi:hypothetical protein